MENESEVKITFTGEHGEFSIRKFINREKPECVLCEKKTDCDEYFFFFVIVGGVMMRIMFVKIVH